MTAIGIAPKKQKAARFARLSGLARLEASAFVFLTLVCSVFSSPSARPAEGGSPKREPNLYYSDGLRKWTPEDSINLRYYSHPAETTSWLSPETALTAVRISDSGRYFFIVSHTGDIERDETVYTLQVWDADEVARRLAASSGQAPKPVRTVQLGSLNSHAAIDHARFEEGKDAILFLGTDSGGVANVHRLNVATGRIEQLSHHKNPVDDFLYGGGTLLYLSRGLMKPLAELRYPMQLVERGGPGSMGIRVEARKARAWRAWINGGDIFVASAETGERQILTPAIFSGFAPPALSPDGRLALADIYEGGKNYVVRFDLKTGEWQRLGSRVSSNPLVWSADGRQAFLGVLPRAGAGPNPVWGDLVVYDRDSNKLRIVGPAPDYFAIRSVRWLTPHSFQIVRFQIVRRGEDRQPDQLLVYERSGTGWTERLFTDRTQAESIAPSALPGGMTVELRQGGNIPPVLFASLKRRSVALTEADPLLRQVWWAKTQPFQWTEPDGTAVTGGLFLPRNRPAGARLPLVIQAYHYYPDIFLPDGPHRGTADSAQSLVARGFAVLQIEAWKEDTMDKPEEGPSFVTRIDAAVGALVDKGIVDPARIALTGFSRGGYMTHFAITHPGKYPLAAAVIDDSWDGFFSDYLDKQWSDPPYGKNFWQDKKSWLKLELSFNADRVRTPALFSRHQRGERDEYEAQLLDVSSTFDLNAKPMEFLVFPDGEHSLQRPREQLELHRAVLDWVAYWLRGEVPMDNERAARWAQLRNMQDQVLKQPMKPQTQWVELPANFDTSNLPTVH